MLELHDSALKVCQENSLCMLVQGVNRLALSIPEPEGSKKVNTVKYVQSFIDLCKNNYLVGGQQITALTTNSQFPGLTSDKAIKDLGSVLKIMILDSQTLQKATRTNPLTPHSLLTTPTTDALPDLVQKSTVAPARWEAFYSIPQTPAKSSGEMLCMSETPFKDDILADYERSIKHQKSTKTGEKTSRIIAKVQAQDGTDLGLLSSYVTESSDKVEVLEDMQDFFGDAMKVYLYSGSSGGVFGGKSKSQEKQMYAFAIVGILMALFFAYVRQI